MQTLEAPKTALDIALDNLSDFISKWGTIAAVITFAVLTISGIAQVGFGEYFSGGVLNIIQKIAQNFSVALTIIVAAVVIAYFIQTISAEISAYIGFTALMLQIVATVGILAILLICYFISTWIIFRRSVNP